MSVYIAPDRKILLEAHEINSFEKVWNFKASWFEEPNSRRGGWSGVGRLSLAVPGGAELGVFLKRQENHQRRTLLHPFRGEPTFSCEFRMMQYLRSKGVTTPKPIFFAQDIVNDKPCAILMTEELAGYKPLEVLAEEMFAAKRPTLAEQRSILRAVATTVRKLHQARIQHRSLYPKHLFVQTESHGEPSVAVIDLEKSRIKLLRPMRIVYDLATLDRHARHWSRSRRLYFFMQYLGISKLTPWTKLLCRLIHKRSHRP